MSLLERGFYLREKACELSASHRRARNGRPRARLELVGEIDGRFDVRPRLHDLLPHAFQGLREAAFQVVERRARRLFGLRGHQIGHGFGLHQVDLPLQEGAPGELAFHGRPGAHLAREAQDGPHDGRAAVAVHLDHVLAGNGTRRLMIERETLIEGLAPVHEAPQHGPAPGKRASLLSGLEDSW